MNGGGADRWTDGQTDRRTDAQNFRGYNNIPPLFWWRGIKILPYAELKIITNYVYLVIWSRGFPTLFMVLERCINGLIFSGIAHPCGKKSLSD